MSKKSSADLYAEAKAAAMEEDDGPPEKGGRPPISGMSDTDREELRSSNEHLYDLVRIRDSLRVQIMALEEKFKDSPSDRTALTLVTLYKSYTEVIAEIRMIEEQNQYASIIVSTVLDPLTSGMFQSFTDLLYHLNKVVSAEVGNNERVKQTFDKLAIEYGRYIDSRRKEAIAQIEAVFAQE